LVSAARTMDALIKYAGQFAMRKRGWSSPGKALLLLAGLLAGGGLRAADFVTSPTVSNWSLSTSWINTATGRHGVPNTTDNVLIKLGNPIVVSDSGTYAAYAYLADNGYLHVETSLIGISSSMLGGDAGTTGVAEMMGTRAYWHSGELTVGGSGRGELSISGGSLESTGAILGWSVGGTGVASITSGTWQSGAFVVGGGGNGALTISGGLVATPHQFTIGDGQGGVGRVDASKGGLETDTLVIGRMGQGSFYSSIGLKTRDTVIGQESTGKGYASVAGTWDVMDELTVGDMGEGTLDVQGGILTTGTRWGDFYADGALVVGGHGRGTMNVNAGSVTASHTWVGEFAGSSGTLTVNGGAFDGGWFQIGKAGTGLLVVSGGLATISTRPSDALTIGVNASGTGAVMVTGGTLAVPGEPGTTVGSSGEGSLTLSDAGVLKEDYYGGGPDFEGGTTDTVTLGRFAGSKGTLNIGAGGVAGTVLASWVKSGEGEAIVNFNHTGTVTFAPKLAGSMSVNKLGAGTTLLTGSNSFTGRTTVSDGALFLATDMPLVGDVVLQTGGTLGFGANPRDVTMAGNLTMNGGALALKVNGTGAGMYDRVAVGQSFTVSAGGLTVNLGYTPAAGDSYKIFSSSAMGGGHFGVQGALPAGLAWTTDALAETGELAVVQLTTWTNATGGSWNDPVNWSSGAPTAAVSAVFTRDAVISPDEAAYLDLFIGKPDQTAYVEFVNGNMNGTSTYVGYEAGTHSTAEKYFGSWTNANEFVVGEFGSGTLILSHTIANDRTMIIGAQRGSEGTTLVNSSTVSHGESLVVGQAGAGVMKLGYSLMTNDRAVIGADAGSNGSMLVQSSTWQVAKDLVVGDEGTGSLAISKGYLSGVTVATGVISSDTSVIGAKVGGTGSVQIDGGTWTTAKSLIVGDAGTGSLNITGGLVTDADAVVGRTGSGSAVVSGGTWDSANSLTIGESGTGTLSVAGGGHVVIGGGSGTLVLAKNAGSSGELDVGGLSLVNGALLSGGALNAAEVTGGNGTATVNFSGYSGTFAPRLTGSISVNRSTVPYFGIGSGKLVMTGSNSYTGTTNVTGGMLIINGDNSAATGDVTVGPGGMLGGTGTVGGNITVSGTASSQSASALVARGSSSSAAESVNASSVVINTTGTLANTGGTGAVVISGTFNSDAYRGRLAPGGDGTGLFTALGDVTIQQGGLLALDFGGTAAGLFDQISVGGTFTLRGTLSLNVNYAAQEGDSFLVFTNGGYDAGTFDLVTNLDSSLAWNTSVLAKTGMLSIEAKSQIWQKSGTGNWNAAANWSDTTTPTAQTNATIDNGGVVLLGKGISGTSKALRIGREESGRGTVSIAGGSLVTASASIGEAVGSSGTVAVSSGTWSNAGDLVVGASGAGTLSVTDLGVVSIGAGSGTLALARDAGSTGVLQFTNAKSVPTLRAAEVTGGAGIALANFDISGSMAFAPRLTGSLAVTKLGKGALTLGGNNSYSGGTTLTAGILNINSANAIGTGALSISGPTTINNTSGTAVTLATNNAQNWNANLSFAGSNDLNLGVGAVTMAGSRTVTVTAKTLAVGGVISGTGSVTKAGAGALTLSGSNGFSGGVVLQAGTLNLGNAHALGGGALTIAGSSTLNNTSGAALTLADHTETWNANFAFFGTQDLNLGAGAVALTGARTVTVNAGRLTVGGVIDGAKGSLTKAGAGTLVLTGLNTYGGATTIGAGTLQLGDGLSDGGLSALSKVTDNGVLVFDQVADGTFANVISGKGQVMKDGANRLTLSGANGYSGGTVLNAGGLVVGNAKALGSGELIVNGGTLDVGGQNVSVGGLAGAGGNIVNNGGTASVLAINNKVSGSYAGSLANGTSALSFTKSGNAGFILTGANTYTGVTTVASGTLQLGNGGTTGSIASASLVNNGSVVYARSDAVTYGGVISGKGGVKQSGAGALTLTGANTFTGGFIINDGEVRVGSDSALGLGSVTLNDGELATDGVEHRINVKGNFTWMSSAHIALTLALNPEVSERVVVSGKLSLAGTGKFTFDFTPLDLITGDPSFVVMTVAGGFGKLTASNFAYTTDDAGLTGSFRIAGNQLIFDDAYVAGLGAPGDGGTIGAVPEPSTWGMVVLGLALMAFGWRRGKTGVRMRNL